MELRQSRQEEHSGGCAEWGRGSPQEEGQPGCDRQAKM